MTLQLLPPTIRALIFLFTRARERFHRDVFVVLKIDLVLISILE